ncbi:35063_t:CDS:2, partial [Gigaspora margarita]
MSTELYDKIYNFLTTAENKKINAISVVYLGMKKDRWIEQSELKATVKRAVEFASNMRMESSRQLRISQILSQFDNAFEGVSGLYDMGAIKSDKEKPLDFDKIKKNINSLKDKLQKDNTALYQHLYSAVSSYTINKLTWKDPLASQVISDKSEIVENLRTNYKKAFEKIKRDMKPPSILRIRGMCEEFVSNFINRNYQNLLPEKLTHNKTWKESEETILDIVKEVFIILEDIWVNPAFNSNLAESLNEGTYQSTVIFLLIKAILKNLPFGFSSFISTCERQSIAISDRKGEGNIGRKPDMMYVVKYLDAFFEIMYLECSRLYCNQQKKTDDEIKLWRECNDGMYYTRKILKPEKDQFGIIGIQIAGNMMHLNVLVRDKTNINRYYHIQTSEIPVRASNPNIVTDFIETLLLLRNILITNISLLYHGVVCVSERQKEDYTTEIKLQTRVNTNEQDTSLIEDISQSSACLESPVTLEARRNARGTSSNSPSIEDHSDKDYRVSINASQLKAEPASLEDKEIDEFLDSKYKEKVSEEIIQSIKEKKLRDQETIITSQNTAPIISHEQGFIQEISAGNDASPSIQDYNFISPDHVTEISLTSGQEKLSILQNIAHLYEKACDAEDESIKANQAEILCWSDFIIVLDRSLDEIMNRDKVKYTDGQDNSSDNLFETETRSSASSKLLEAKVNISTKSISTDSKKLSDTGISIPPISQVNTFNKTRLPISVLPDDPEEKRNHIIKMVLEQFPYLTLKYSNEYGDYFTCSVS